MLLSDRHAFILHSVREHMEDQSVNYSFEGSTPLIMTTHEPD